MKNLKPIIPWKVYGELVMYNVILNHVFYSIVNQALFRSLILDNLKVFIFVLMDIAQMHAELKLYFVCYRIWIRESVKDPSKCVKAKFPLFIPMCVTLNVKYI